jgi:hypothetical protein
VSAANNEIASALARGISLATMVEAARQYAEWIKAQPWQDKDKYTKGATNFIKQECWLEDYTVKPKEVKAKAGKVKGKATSTTTKTGRPKKQQTEAHRKWRAGYKSLSHRSVLCSRQFRDHIDSKNKCTICVAAARKIDGYAELCSIGKSLIDKRNMAEKLITQYCKENPEPEMWETIT